MQFVENSCSCYSLCHECFAKFAEALKTYVCVFCSNDILPELARASCLV